MRKYAVLSEQYHQEPSKAIKKRYFTEFFFFPKKIVLLDRASGEY
jgi:hypothetical protein